MIRISIISICFNNPEELKLTLESVDQQSIAPFEHWIINGSTEPDIDRLLKSQPSPPYRHWLSEPDKGISDAFNKGIQRANGDIVVMLNAGDRFYNTEALSTAETVFSQHPEISWLHSKYELHRGHKWIIIGKPFEKSKLYRGMRSICHQSMFVRKSLHEQYGLYDTELKIAMDYDFLLRIANEPFLFVEKPLIKFAPGGASSQQYKRGLFEMRSCYIKYYGRSWKLNLWQWRLRLIRRLMTTRFGKWLYRIKTGLRLENM